MSTDKGLETDRTADDVETVGPPPHQPDAVREDALDVVVDDDVRADAIAAEPDVPPAVLPAEDADLPPPEPAVLMAADFAVDPGHGDVLAPEPETIDPRIARLADRILSVAERMKAEPAEIVPDAHEAWPRAELLRSSDALDLTALGLGALLAPRASLIPEAGSGEARAEPQPAQKPVLTVREVLENAAPRLQSAEARDEPAIAPPAPEPGVPLDVLKAWVEQAEADTRVAADRASPSAEDHFSVVQRSAYSVLQYPGDHRGVASTWDVMLKGISGFAAGLATSALAGFLLLHFMSGN